MIYTLAHELAEGITDPQPDSSVANGYGSASGEIADVCQGQWGDYWEANGTTTEFSNWFTTHERCAGVDKIHCFTIDQSYIMPTLDVNTGGGFCAMELPVAPNCTITPSACLPGPEILPVRNIAFSCEGSSGDVTQNVVFQRNLGSGWTTFDQIPVASTGYPLTPYTASTTVNNGGGEYRVCTANADGNGGLLCGAVVSSDLCTFRDPSPRPVK